MEQLSGLDAMFIHAELHGLPMHISSFSIYDPSTAPDGKVDFKQVLEIFEKKIQHQVPILRNRLVEVPMNLDQPYWAEDPRFDMVYHVRHIALPKPADWNKLFTLVANLHAQPLNRARPLWEAYVIDGLDKLDGIPKGCFGLFLKVHHAIMDGRTGLALYSNLHTITPDLPVFEQKANLPAKTTAVEESTGLSSLMFKAAAHNTRKTMNLGKTLLGVAKTFGKLQLGMRSGELHSLEKPKCRFNGPISPGRVVDRQRLPIQDVKLIRSVSEGATVNDVALTIIGGAMRRYLAEKDELPEQSLVSGVPIDVRTQDDADKPGNRVSFMNVPLCSNIEDPLERLRVLHKEALASKQFASTLGRTFVNDVLDDVYAGLASWGIRSVVESGALSYFAPVHNTIITNVPGAPMPIYLAGAKLIDSFGLGPLMPNTGLFHTVTSTYECLSISFTACRDMMPDPEFYSQCLADSFEELLDAALEQRAQMIAANEQESRKAQRRAKRQTRRIHASRAAGKAPVKPAVRKAKRKQPPVDAVIEAGEVAEAAKPSGLTVVSDNTGRVTHG
ncbi:MAG: wax ester/triacylglycerol synthase family O-acyltransferase [Gammaproteobacteria bacterium]|nr:MAG: wax ester/triacylglycerol synthase family O-acyltransferase [Gammaproteobacteria bacterium]